MVAVEIGGNKRKLEEGNIEPWIRRQLRKRDGKPTCASVTVREGDVNVRLPSGACASSGGGGSWQPNRRERALIDLWEKLGLDGADAPPPGKLVAFLKRMRRVL